MAWPLPICVSPVPISGFDMTVGLCLFRKASSGNTAAFGRRLDWSGRKMRFLLLVHPTGFSMGSSAAHLFFIVLRIYHRGLITTVIVFSNFIFYGLKE